MTGDDDDRLLEAFGLGGGVSPGPSEEAPRETFARRLDFKGSISIPLPRVRPARRTIDRTFGLGPVEIQPGASTTLVVQLRCWFQIERLVASETVPGATAIIHFFVGAMSRFPMGSKFATALFSQGGTLFPFGDPCPAAIPVSFGVENLGRVPVTWSGAIFGKELVLP